MTLLTATIEGIGFWAPGVPDWETARRLIRDGVLPDAAPRRPSPQLLAPNERRRAPETVAVALEVALAACVAAGRDPASMPSVFASTHGDLAITDYMCATLVSQPRMISPTRFHNSVHNAAAGYWTIGVGALRATTAISALDCSFAQGLLEAMVQLASGEEAVLLVGYDAESTGPLAAVSRSVGLLGGALVLSSVIRDDAPRIQMTLAAAGNGDDAALRPPGALAALAAGNAMAPMLPVFDALASRAAVVRLPAGLDQIVQLQLTMPRAADMTVAVPAGEESADV